MKSEFEKLLSNCQNRVNEQVKVINISNDSILEIKKTLSSNKNSTDQLRPGVKNLIEQKMRETQTNVERPKEKAKILFSLKDFQEKKEQVEANADNDEVPDDELNEDDECVRDVSFDNDDVEMSDSEEEKNQENPSVVEEVEVVKNKVEAPSPSPSVFEEVGDQEQDLESEIIKLDNIQREVSDRLRATSTVLLKMNDPAGKTKELIKNQARVGVSISKEPTKGDSKNEDKKKEVIDIVDAKEDVEVLDEKIDSASRKKTANLNQGAFRNISISVVGGKGNASKNIDIQNLFNSKSSSTSKPPPSSSNKTNAGPNISLKRKSSPSKPAGNCFDKKMFKSSAIAITPAVRKEAPTIILEDGGREEEESPSEDLSSQYDNCTHGDPLGYLCLDCIHLRWKTGYEFVKTRKEKPKKVEEAVEKEKKEDDNVEKPPLPSDEPADIIKNVNWQQVFSFAGISVEQSQNQRRTWELRCKM